MPNDDCLKCHLGIKHHHHEDSANRCLYEDASGVERCAYEETPPSTGGVAIRKLLEDWISWAEEWGDRDMRQSLIARTKRALENRA
jgi:hypothetical protein